jgi:hypothetical protein
MRCVKAIEQNKRANEKKKKKPITKSGRDGSSERMVRREKARIEVWGGEGAKSGRTTHSVVASGVGWDRGHTASD